MGDYYTIEDSFTVGECPPSGPCVGAQDGTIVSGGVCCSGSLVSGGNCCEASDCPSSPDPCDQPICSINSCGFGFYKNLSGCSVNGNLGSCVSSSNNGLCKVTISGFDYCYDKSSGSWVVASCP